jgi:hypothetical protein
LRSGLPHLRGDSHQDATSVFRPPAPATTRHSFDDPLARTGAIQVFGHPQLDDLERFGEPFA